jgi:hypothetical protein
MEAIHFLINVACGVVLGYCLQPKWKFVAGIAACAVFAVNTSH